MDSSAQLQDLVQTVIAQKSTINVIGANSKSFYGNHGQGKVAISTTHHTGIIDYAPQADWIHVRSGTALTTIEQTLQEQGQVIASEPPGFSGNSTVGGIVAAGLSGPARPWRGALRDQIAGISLLDGHGHISHFGELVPPGKPTPNIDLSRLISGSLGTLGIILDIKLRVYRQPESERTVALEMPMREALEYCMALRRSTLPLTAVCYFDDCLYVRLSGATKLVQAAHSKLGGEQVLEADEFWLSLRNQTHEFFQQNDRPLWRLSMQPTAVDISGLAGQHTLIDWAGAQRWVYSNIPTNIMRTIASKHNGHATLYRGRLPGVNAFQPLSKPLQQLRLRIKHTLDPQGIFNPGRMYWE